MYDAIIVGGGPAGLAAAQALGRSLRSTLVLDSGEPRNAPAAHMHNFITRDGTPPAEFRRIAREELSRYDTIEIRDLPATDIVPLPDDGFAVTLDGEETVRGRKVLLATGVVDEQPPIEGIAELWGRGVYHCPFCHGYEVRGMPLAVLGGSPAAVHLALHLRHLSDDVVLCTHGDAIDPATGELLAANGVPVREEPVIRLDAIDGALERIVFASGEPLARQAVFSGLAPMRQRSELPGRLGCRMLDDDAVEIDQLGQTSVPGVFAAGDMARRADSGRMSAVIAAAASGTIAGAAIARELVTEDADRAVRTSALARSA